MSWMAKATIAPREMLKTISIAKLVISKGEITATIQGITIAMVRSDERANRSLKCGGDAG
jgi:hypothetical protein